MSSDDRYCPYKMSVFGDRLIISSATNPNVEFDLESIYLQTNDAPGRKCTDSRGKNYCTRIMITDTKNSMKLYFVTYDSMIESVNKILDAQGLDTRLDQYSLVKSLPDALVC